MVDPDSITRLNAALEGRYRIERELGAGGMATVYLAEDVRHHRNVALKVLKPELAAVVGSDRFLAEIETTANLQHPHILPLFDSGEAEGFLFYVMPYVEGESLRERLDRENQLPVDEAVQIASKVASALDYAHNHGVIHRDIKPANILLSESGEPLVSDFGIALAVSAGGGDRLTETGLSLGTPHYMSPEQATGDLNVGAQTDIYALGCVLYEMLVGEPPYAGSTAQAVLGKIVTGAADPVSEHRPVVPQNVDGAVRKALEKLPADRFAGARDLARALDQPGFRYGERATQASETSAGPWKTIALVLATLFTASTAGLVWSLQRPEPPRPVARFESPFGRQVPRGPMEFTPDGSALVYVAPSPSGRRSQLWMRRLDDPAATPITGTEGVWANTYLEFSPNGREVAFAGGMPPALMVVPVEGGPARQLAPSSIGAHGWTSDDILYFQSQQDFAIHRVPATGGGEPEVVTELDDGERAHDALRFLPGGRMAVFTVHTGGVDPEIWALDVETGERRMLTQGIAPRYTSTGHLLYIRADGTLTAAPIDEDAEMGPTVSLFGGIQIVSGVARYAVSSAGTLAYIGGGTRVNNSLVWVDRDGSEQPLPLESQIYAYPRISPDGSRLVVAVVGDDADLWVFDLDRLTRSRITYGGNNRFFPVWSPNGDQIAFSTRPVRGNAIVSAWADGSRRTDTLLARDGVQAPTSWSIDGRVLAFYEMHPDRPENGRDIWVMPLDGEPEAFLVTPFQERAAVFSPDGRWLAYTSNKSGRDEVYLLPFPGPGREVVLSSGGGTQPVWSPDGSELFYRSDDEMMAVDLTDATRPGAPQPLWPDVYVRESSNGQNYDVHGDGPRFLMVRPQEAKPGQVHVVLNWFEELRRRMGS